MSFAGIKSIRDMRSSSSGNDDNYISDEFDFDDENDNDFSDRRNVGHSDDESDEMFLSMTVDCE